MFKKKKYSEGYIDYPGVGIITDEDVAKMVKDHTHWWDRLDYHKVSDASILATGILMKVITPEEAVGKPQKGKKWYL